MISERRRLRRLRLLVGIITGLVVGTMHALASHVTMRDVPATTVIEQPGWSATDTDVAAR